MLRHFEVMTTSKSVKFVNEKGCTLLRRSVVACMYSMWFKNQLLK